MPGEIFEGILLVNPNGAAQGNFEATSGKKIPEKLLDELSKEFLEEFWQGLLVGLSRKLLVEFSNTWRNF